MNIPNRETMPEDTSFTETGTSLRAPITVIPIFVGIGFLSALFAIWFWSTTLSPPHNEYLYELLASSVLGLALVAVLWSLRLVPSWGGAIAIVAAMIAAHSLEQFLDPYLLRDENPCWNCSPTESFVPGGDPIVSRRLHRELRDPGCDCPAIWIPAASSHRDWKLGPIRGDDRNPRSRSPIASCGSHVQW